MLRRWKQRLAQAEGVKNKWEGVSFECIWWDFYVWFCGDVLLGSLGYVMSIYELWVMRMICVDYRLASILHHYPWYKCRNLAFVDMQIYFGSECTTGISFGHFRLWHTHTHLVGCTGHQQLCSSYRCLAVQVWQHKSPLFTSKYVYTIPQV